MALNAGGGHPRSFPVLPVQNAQNALPLIFRQNPVPEQSYALPSELIVRGNVVIWWLASYYSADRMLTAQRADLQPRRGAVVPCVVIASERASWSSLSAGGEGETLHS